MIIQGEIINISNNCIASIDIINNSDKSSLNITYLTTSTLYHYINNKIIYIILLSNKKYKETYTTIDIAYGDSDKYVLIDMYNTKTAIMKKAKKILTQHHNPVSANKSIYSFNNSYIFTSDFNGYISYYPDTIEIYDNTTINTFINTHFTSIPDINYNIDNLITTFNYKLLDIQTTQNAYILNNITPHTTQHTTCNNIFSTIINWINPLAYYYNTPAPINTTSQEPQYYIHNDMHIIKVHNNTIKILKPIQMQFPIQIENITLDTQDNIIFYGKLNDTTTFANIIYNKFLHNPTIELA